MPAIMPVSWSIFRYFLAKKMKRCGTIWIMWIQKIWFSCIKVHLEESNARKKSNFVPLNGDIDALLSHCYFLDSLHLNNGTRPSHLIWSQTRKHSSRMYTPRLPTVPVLVADTRCQYHGVVYLPLLGYLPLGYLSLGCLSPLGIPIS